MPIKRSWCVIGVEIGPSAGCGSVFPHYNVAPGT
jgi:hypothetical protein